LRIQVIGVVLACLKKAAESFESPAGAADLTSGILALRDTGRGLWGAHVGQAASELRDEWGSA
jgi:hypothetical protein